MTIRNRLLGIILPPIIFVSAISCWICHSNWKNDIIESYQSRLQLTAIGCSCLINGTDHQWLDRYRNHPSIDSNARFISCLNSMQRFANTIPGMELYTATIKPVLTGDTVLSNIEEGYKNPKNNGKDLLLAYRKVYLLYALKNGLSVPTAHPGGPDGPYNFCQNNEQEMYYKDKSTVTPVYRSLRTGKKTITAYAPIKDDANNIVAFVGADLPLSKIQPKIFATSLLIFTFACATITVTVFGIFFVSSYLTKPLERLHNTTLAIASGDYGQQIRLIGPMEMEQLSDSFNIMSCCLKERHKGAIESETADFL